MSLSTRCPSCSTTFKVVPDQLKVSDGWVRCGQCAEVFDATAHLRALIEGTDGVAEPQDAAETEDPSAPPLPEPPRQEASRDPAGPSTSEPAAVWLRRSPAARIVLNGEAPPMPRSPAEGEADDVDSTDDPHGDFPGEGDSVPSALLLQTADNDEPQQSLYQPAFVHPAPVAGTLEADADIGDAAATLRELDFVRVAERRAFWQRPMVVAGGLAVCVALAAALALQVARAERDRLAAHLPGLKPLLVSLCVPLRCEVAPLRRIESIAIDGSSFNKVRDEFFQFDVEMRNSATTALAMPAVELTLTDTQDQPLLRRVLLPAELHAPPVVAAGAAWSGSLPVRLQAPVAPERVAGYRVLVFYP